MCRRRAPVRSSMTDACVVDLRAADPALPSSVIDVLRGGPAMLARARAVVDGATARHSSSGTPSTSTRPFRCRASSSASATTTVATARTRMQISPSTLTSLRRPRTPSSAPTTPSACRGSPNRRLRGRTRRRHRRHGFGRVGGRCARLCRRLHGRQRRLGARRPEAWQPVGARQVIRHLRPHGSGARNRGRDPRSSVARDHGPLQRYGDRSIEHRG